VSGSGDADTLAAVVIETLEDESASGDAMARRAARSRTQFFRVFKAMIDETPLAMRRRLLLERAAWQLGRTRHPVTDIAFDAQYGSLEAFTRAFHRAFGVSPSLYRRMGATHFHLQAPSAIHFCAPGSPPGDNAMDLFDIFAGSDTYHARRLLEYARGLTPEQLDAPLDSQSRVFPWDEPARSLRQLLERIVQNKEAWAAALTGGPLPAWAAGAETPETRTPDALLQRLEAADAGFMRVLTDVRNRNAWSDTFVDALCEPPETFSFGGIFAHVITMNGHQRLLAMDALRRLGVQVEGFGCPTEYEATVSPVRHG
jgi:AraC family transcriptional regulator